MTKKHITLDRTNGAPDIAWNKESGGTVSIWILAKGDYIKCASRKSITFVGPSVVIKTECLEMTDEVEYDVDSPFVWAYVSRILNEGFAQGRVTSPMKERNADVSRKRLEEARMKT